MFHRVLPITIAFWKELVLGWWHRVRAEKKGTRARRLADSSWRCCGAVCCLGVCVCHHHVCLQGKVPDQGFEWVSLGAPGRSDQLRKTFLIERALSTSYPSN